MIIGRCAVTKPITMSKSANGLAVKKVTDILKFTSVTDVLQEWDHSLSNILQPDDGISLKPRAINFTGILSQQNNLCDNIQRLILDEMIGRSGVRDKEQFIRMVQLMVTQLLDKVSSVTESKPELPEKEALSVFTQMLLAIIYFIQEFFGNYFDKNEKIPSFLCIIYKNELIKLGEKLARSLDQSPEINPALIHLLKDHSAEAVWMNRRHCNYKHFYYEKELLLQLLKENTLTDLSARSLLYYFNFNCSSFVIYEFDRLVELITQLPTKSEKINKLRAELKSINQLPSKINCCFDEDMPSLKEQVSTWIMEEIKYCEAGHFIQAPVNSTGESENKIHTTLSVAKLSLLVRLLVVDKIIINRTVAPMLRTVAKTFSTLQREEISFGSLETKYHAPDKATIDVMKAMLQKWIIILGKL